MLFFILEFILNREDEERYNDKEFEEKRSQLFNDK